MTKTAVLILSLSLLLLLQKFCFAWERDTISTGWTPGHQDQIPEEALVDEEKLYNYDIELTEAQYADRPVYGYRYRYYSSPGPHHCYGTPCRPHRYHRCDRYHCW